MSLENMDKTSQAQQIRQNAFHMASRFVDTGYSERVRPDFAEVAQAAEEIEEWIWKADEERGLRFLLAAAEEALNILKWEQMNAPNDPREECIEALRGAIGLFNGTSMNSLTKRKPRR